MTRHQALRGAEQNRTGQYVGSGPATNHDTVEKEALESSNAIILIFDGKGRARA